MVKRAVYSGKGMVTCRVVFKREMSKDVAINRMLMPVEDPSESRTSVREREPVEFRVVKSETIDAVVLSSEEIAVAEPVESQNPLDIQARYVVQGQESSKYLSYDSPFQAVERDAQVYREVERDDQCQRAVVHEIVQKKIHAMRGASWQPDYADYNEQVQMEWYKRVNTFFIMFLYDAV